jgi:hypothetical protein
MNIDYTDFMSDMLYYLYSFSCLSISTQVYLYIVKQRGSQKSTDLEGRDIKLS